MGTTNITKFAGGATAQVQSDAGYTAQNGPATVGFVDGPADPTQVNKAFRQSSAVAAAVARLATDPAMGNQASFNDSEDSAALATKLRDVINAIADTTKLQKLAQAISTFATDTNGGGQPTFDYTSDPAGVLASKFIQAIYNLPDVKLARLTSTLFRNFLGDQGNNPDSWAKFTDAQVRGLTDAQIRTLATNEIFNFIMTKKILLTNPPVNDWAYLLNLTDVSTYTGVPGYVAQREFRRLANGMVEVRVGYLAGFRTQSFGTFVIGELPFELAPVGYCTSIIYGSVSDRNASATDMTYTYDGDFMVVVSPPFLDGITNTYTNPAVYVATKQPEYRYHPWTLKHTMRSNPYDKPKNSTDQNVLSGTVVSICYMPRMPYPYAYYKGPAT